LPRQLPEGEARGQLGQQRLIGEVAQRRQLGEGRGQHGDVVVAGLAERHPAAADGVAEPAVHPGRAAGGLDPRQDPQQPPGGDALHLRRRLGRGRQVPRRRGVQAELMVLRGGLGCRRALLDRHRSPSKRWMLSLHIVRAMSDPVYYRNG
jgi:hypothetical protein